MWANNFWVGGEKRIKSFLFYLFRGGWGWNQFPRGTGPASIQRERVSVGRVHSTSSLQLGWPGSHGGEDSLDWQLLSGRSWRLDETSAALSGLMMSWGRNGWNSPRAAQWRYWAVGAKTPLAVSVAQLQKADVVGAIIWGSLFLWHQYKRL